MSESFPFPAADEADAGTDRKKMALVAGVGALMVAVLGYFVVVPALSGGDSGSAPTTMVKKAPQQVLKKGKADAKAKAAQKAPAAKKPAAQPANYSDLSARSNPFRELWKEPTQQSMSSAPSGAARPMAPVGPAAPGGAGSGSGGSGSGGAQSAPGSSAAVGGQRVALMTVYAKDGNDYAQTRIGDVVYTPKVGQVFAVSYKLLAVSGKTATYLYGDEQFTLSVGQEVLK